MAAGAWAKMLWQSMLFRQTMAMDDGESPIDPDPFSLLGGFDQKEQVAPYNPAIWSGMAKHGVT